MNLERLLEGVLKFFHADWISVQPIVGPNYEYHMQHRLKIHWRREDFHMDVGYIDYSPDEGWFLIPQI
jgi:hypothetical protein